MHTRLGGQERGAGVHGGWRRKGAGRPRLRARGAVVVRRKREKERGRFCETRERSRVSSQKKRRWRRSSSTTADRRRSSVIGAQLLRMSGT
jgi:hypothetical protein